MKFSLSLVVTAFALGVNTVVAAPISHSVDVTSRGHEHSDTTPSHEHARPAHDADGHGSEREHEHVSYTGSSASHHASRRELVYDILQERYPSIIQAREYSGAHVARALVEDM
ncbi:hypothetical protein CPB83DRAFT_855204 [Crepidotus variabilis]|uniref:Uncharacterized protein n=1 Tax=Crepidotus variabilis TaxID=179855 RepID=A0A9P6EEH4_9AGAR|nr:hypothetical protein CPB83DRAFT_855204 [Crepidotus variabilis]